MGRITHRAGGDHWTYEIYSKDTPADQLGAFDAFKKLWDSKRVGDRLPAWRNFELEDFAPWYGWISVEDVIPGPAYDSVFRLWGTNLVQFYGKDLTNRRMSEFVGDLFSPVDMEVLQALLGTHNFRMCRGPTIWPTDDCSPYSSTYSFIELPLADDGKNVDRYINLALATETT